MGKVGLPVSLIKLNVVIMHKICGVENFGIYSFEVLVKVLEGLYIGFIKPIFDLPGFQISKGLAWVP